MPHDDSLIRPRALRPGDTVRIVAPASPFDRDRFEKGVARLEAMGFRVTWKDDVFASDRYLAGNDERRAKELMDAFADPSVHGVICARGGYGSPRILDRLDFAALAKSWKVFVGFSDVTALHLAFADRGLVSFHGPNVTGLGDRVEERGAFLHAVGRAEPQGEVASGETIVPGVARGRLIGGNLAMVAATLGTPFFPEMKDAILFLEDVGERPFRVDRTMTSLRLAGMLDRVAGIALGRFSGCDNPSDASYDGAKIVAEIAKEAGKPCIAGLAFGHDGENRTIPVGIRGRIENGALWVDEPAVTAP